MFFFRAGIASVVSITVAASLFCCACSYLSLFDADTKGDIGFFSPQGVDREYARKIDFSMVLAYTQPSPENGSPAIDLSQLGRSFEIVRGSKHIIHIDLSLVICESKKPYELNTSYISMDGKARKKAFKPLEKQKLLRIVNDKEIERRLGGFVEFVKKHRDNVGVLFIADEPYINGIDRKEIERATRKIKTMFASEGVGDIKTGVIFAAAMFNKEFAGYIQQSMAEYVRSIDRHYYKNRRLLKEQSEDGRKFRQWVSVIEKSRLTTYDACGNIYKDGGLPEGLDVAAFDFYLSTMLLDSVYDGVLKYYAAQRGIVPCAYFKEKTAGDLRKEISFFSTDTTDINKQTRTLYENDRMILDMAFNCRMQGTAELLLTEIKRQGPQGLKTMLIGESSANGLRQFNPDRTPKAIQPPDLIEQRMLDEVKRTLDYYSGHTGVFDGGLMFFLYPDAFDDSINLPITGIKGSKKVSGYIYRERYLLKLKLKSQVFLKPHE